MKRFLPILFLIAILSNVFAAPWDFLRLAANQIMQLQIGIALIALIVSVVIFGIALLAYAKKKSRRLALIAVAFGLFFVKILLGFADLFVSPGYFMNPALLSFFDLVVLAVLFIALFRN